MIRDRVFRDRTNPLDTFNDADLVKRYRFSRVGIGRNEMFYLTTHSTHFILRLYGVRHMVKDHSDSER